MLHSIEGNNHHTLLNIETHTNVYLPVHLIYTYYKIASYIALLEYSTATIYSMCCESLRTYVTL